MSHHWLILFSYFIQLFISCIFSYQLFRIISHIIPLFTNIFRPNSDRKQYYLLRIILYNRIIIAAHPLQFDTLFTNIYNFTFVFHCLQFMFIQFIQRIIMALIKLILLLLSIFILFIFSQIIFSFIQSRIFSIYTYFAH